MDELRARIRSFLKLAPPEAPRDLQVVERTMHDGYASHLIEYFAADGDRIEARFLQPTGARLQGTVLVLHQHNSQWSLGKSEVVGSAGDALQAFGPALARRGVAVLAPDAIGFESRMQVAGCGMSLIPALHRSHSTEEGWRQYYNQMAHRLVQGDLLMRKHLADAALALSVPQALTAEEPGAVGVIGHSLGGILTLFLTALDTRVDYACSSGAAGSLRRKINRGAGLEMSLIIPGFLQHFDLEDLMCCIPPRRLFVVSSDEDPQTADANELVSCCLTEYERQQRSDHLRHLRVPGGHALDQQRFEAIVEWTIAQSTMGALENWPPPSGAE